MHDNYLIPIQSSSGAHLQSHSRHHLATIVVPSFNERENVFALIGEINAALPDVDAEIIYVDDSTDDTALMVEAAAGTSRLPVRVLHREQPAGGLAGAVVDGIRASRSDLVIVMDADLQHPAALIPALLQTAADEDLDVVMASRYSGDGDASGLSSSSRRSVSGVSTVLARSCFPRRIGQVCTDPMTGFFCVRRASIDLDRLQARGFKILMEILARHDLRVSEIPFTFGHRAGGESKASWRNGLQFLRQMASLRMGRMSRFAAVGGLGTLMNLAIMWVLTAVVGWNYIAAAIIATELTILHNFLLQERYVFRDLRTGLHDWRSRLTRSFAFNNIEAAVRLPVLVLLVSTLHLQPVVVQAVTLALAFLARFVYASRVVYRPEVSAEEGMIWRAALRSPAPLLRRALAAVPLSRRSDAIDHLEPWSWWQNDHPGPDAGAHTITTNRADGSGGTGQTTWSWWATDAPEGSAAGASRATGTTAAEQAAWSWWGTDAPVLPTSRRAIRAARGQIGSRYTTLMVIGAILVVIAASTIVFGIFVTGIATIVTMALTCGVAASIEAGWRLYGRRDPEAIQEMGFPELTTRSGQDSFSIIVPAKDEVEVLHETLETLAQQTHGNVQIIATLIEGDDDTIREAELARSRYPDRIEILVKKYEMEMKPHQLNAALAVCTGDYVGVIDAEDATATGLLMSVEAAFQTSGADVVQGPVQLMTLGMKLREWFMVHNVLEYLFWFSSRMMFQARHGFVPLGGNTVFIRRELLNRAGGWPVSLTEDCALGVKLSTQYGAKVVAVYDPALATKEETPDNVHQLLHQRIRWDTGFGMELLQKKWWLLPTVQRRLLAWYILATPFLQASAGLVLPVTLATAILIDAPVVLVLLTFLSYIPILLSLVLQFVGLHEFGQMFKQKVRLRHYAFLFLGFFPYQLVLAWAAMHAVLRIATGNMTWFKTAHSNKHREVTTVPVLAMSEAA